MMQPKRNGRPAKRTDSRISSLNQMTKPPVIATVSASTNSAVASGIGDERPARQRAG